MWRHVYGLLVVCLVLQPDVSAMRSQADTYEDQAVPAIRSDYSRTTSSERTRGRSSKISLHPREAPSNPAREAGATAQPLSAKPSTTASDAGAKPTALPSPREAAGHQHFPPNQKEAEGKTMQYIAKRLSGRGEETKVIADAHKVAQQSEVYKVLSYNICWGCMEGDAGDKTAMKGHLKSECMKYSQTPGAIGANGMGLNMTLCAVNMRKEIKRYHNAIGSYDLIALQEASNAEDLHLQELSGMKFTKVEFGSPLRGKFHHQGVNLGQQKNAWAVSLYSKARFGAHDEEVSSTTRGRPWLILIFDDKKLMFINNHGYHRGDGVKLWALFLQEMDDLLQTDFHANPQRKKYRVIMAGDFNDGMARLPGCLKIPWQNDLVLTIHTDAPKTCCRSRLGRFLHGYGDFIFDSASLARNRVPKRYNYFLAQSDHLPVEAVLDPKATLPSQSGIHQWRCPIGVRNFFRGIGSFTRTLAAGPKTAAASETTS